ncbi:hypothetical protein CEXT_698731, partial [Caerostris extrusa]
TLAFWFSFACEVSKPALRLEKPKSQSVCPFQSKFALEYCFTVSP